MEGRVRRLCGDGGGSPGAAGVAEVQTAQSQPRVGIPMEVPLPRKVRVACMGSEFGANGRCWGQRADGRELGDRIWRRRSGPGPE